MKKNLKFDILKFSNLIGKNSNTQVVLVNNIKELGKFLKANLSSDEIIIGMGAGAISKWMSELKNLL